MKLISLLFILITFMLNAVALEVILNPYSELDYDTINSYSNDSNDCTCYDYQENYNTQANKNWWE